jgi:hypothetical protein
MPDADSQDRHPAWHLPKPRTPGSLLPCHLQSALRNLKSKIHRGHSSVGRARLIAHGYHRRFPRKLLPTLSQMMPKIRSSVSDLVSDRRSVGNPRCAPLSRFTGFALESLLIAGMAKWRAGFVCDSVRVVDTILANVEFHFYRKNYGRRRKQIRRKRSGGILRR